MSSEEDIYEVGQVLKDRKKRGQIEYLIRWKNFGVDEDSWEPASNLQNAGSVLQDYIKDKATRKSRRSSSRSRSRSRSRTRLLRKKAEKEKAGSRESTPLKKSSREGTPIKKREPTPINSLETATPIEEDLEKPLAEKEATPPLEKEATPPPSPPTEESEVILDTPPPKVVTELTNDGVEESPLTIFTSQITAEATEIFTPVSESVSTVLTRRMEMRAAAKATELEEEQKVIEEEVKEPEPVELVKEVELAEDVLDAPAPDAAPDVSATSELDAEVTTPAPPRQSLVTLPVPARKWPIVVFVVCLLVVGISFFVEKYLRS